MLGKPKFKLNDIVKFKVDFGDELKEIEGSVAIIDKYGTFEQNEEVRDRKSVV